MKEHGSSEQDLPAPDAVDQQADRIAREGHAQLMDDDYKRGNFKRDSEGLGVYRNGWYHDPGAYGTGHGRDIDGKKILS